MYLVLSAFTSTPALHSETPLFSAVQIQTQPSPYVGWYVLQYYI